MINISSQKTIGEKGSTVKGTATATAFKLKDRSFFVLPVNLYSRKVTVNKKMTQTAFIRFEIKVASGMKSLKELIIPPITSIT